MARLAALTGLALVALGLAAPQADKVTSLPGLTEPLGTLYSGYISVPFNGTTYNYHYMFKEAIAVDPSKAPVVLWLNGGPGCSSMEGFLYENGPWWFASDAGSSLKTNPWSWANQTNMIFMESPMGVGFSYASDGSTYTNDNNTADASFEFVKGWMKAFPEYKGNDFYIAGESYAGIYVPMLGYRSLALPNFKGFATGNPVTDYAIDGNPSIAWFPLLYGHAIIPTDFYNAAMAACKGNSESMSCVQYQRESMSKYFAGYNVYNIYGDCTSKRNSKHLPLARVHAHKSDSVGVTPPCANAYAATTWLNKPDVKAALHVKASITWAVCSNIEYEPNVSSTLGEYAAVRAAGKRILTYSGDTDGAVPYTGTMVWAKQIGGPITKGFEWENWTFKKWDGVQVGGHVTYYDNFTYCTVRGSGHMVPQYRPEAAYTMFNNWVFDGQL